jgi:hypothetical protein
MTLASLTPLAFDEGIRFSPNYSFSIVKSNPEVVTEGFIKGRNEMVGSITEGALSALGSISGAYTAARDEKKALEAEERKFEREKELIKARGPTEEQEALDKRYKEAQIGKWDREIGDRINDALPMDVLPSGIRQQMPPIPNMRSQDTTPPSPEPPATDTKPAPSGQLPPPVPKPRPAARTSRSRTRTRTSRSRRVRSTVASFVASCASTASSSENLFAPPFFDITKPGDGTTSEKAG